MATGDPLFLWLLVLAADGLFAGLPGLRSTLEAPLTLVARIAGWFDGKLNRDKRSASSRTLRGALVVLVLALGGWVGGALLAGLAQGFPGGWLIEGAALLCLIHQRRLVDRLRAVARSLAAGDLGAARETLAPMAGFKTDGLDEFDVARGTVETAALRLNEGLAGAAFWYLLLGLPGLCAYRAVNAAARQFERTLSAPSPFGLFARRFNDVLGFVPGIAAGAVLAASAAFVPSASPARAFALWFAALASGRVLGGRICLAPMAGALGLALSGPGQTQGGAGDTAWIGEGRARVTARDVGRAIFLIVVACLIGACLIAALVMARVLA